MSDAGLLNSVLNTVGAQIQLWYPQLLLASTRLVAAVAFLQLGFIFFEAGTTNQFNLHKMIWIVAMGVMRIGLVYAVIDHADVWGWAIVHGCEKMAREVSGQSVNTLTPSGIFDLGLSTASIIMDAKGASTWLHPVQDIEFFFVEVVVILAWALIALAYLGTNIHAFWTIYTGPVYLAFSPFRATEGLLVNWFLEILAIGLRLILLVLLITTMLGMAQTWARELAANEAAISTDLWYLVLSIVQAIIFFFLTATVPSVASHIVGRQASSFFGQAYGHWVPSAAASAATSAASTTAAGAKSAAKSMSDGMHHKTLLAMK